MPLATVWERFFGRNSEEGSDCATDLTCDLDINRTNSDAFEMAKIRFLRRHAICESFYPLQACPPAGEVDPGGLDAALELAELEPGRVERGHRLDGVAVDERHAVGAHRQAPRKVSLQFGDRGHRRYLGFGLFPRSLKRRKTIDR